MIQSIATIMTLYISILACFILPFNTIRLLPVCAILCLLSIVLLPQATILTLHPM
ncbi:uncharacterized protein B0P05DRAFT_557351 [Gilbertella persicaria]|uniref:uncharacterized protein n=1 Tax=Gilbertella persicaria TaxID=101096 RepID=UPI0022206A8C|nr:uncharacterized protein B0P05DRAFT_557351 [Gilbertella persicaria]KAI8061510.1 hypothetical protein B0P05DRAFT_557351 [Gilbertella persicaria]